MAILLQLAALLLQRRAELAGIRASEVNLDQAQWLIPAARMKARRSHLVPLPPEAVELIREAMTLAKAMQPPPAEGETAPTDYPVFPSPRDPRQSIKASSVTQIMKLVTKAIGLENVSPHDLRRTGSSALTSERIGTSRFIRSLVLSHSTEQDGGAAVTGRHYDSNDYIKEKRAALQSWEALLLEIVGERERPSNVKRMRR
jgi:integrase